ncbi:MAG: sel1 repeat family protein [Sphingomonadaceae bacterium]|nr:sel1 repeat family protein [Sphingomonadaceae bacterium]
MNIRKLASAIGLAVLAFLSAQQPAYAQAAAGSLAEANARLGRGDYAGALRIIDPLCRGANPAACTMAEKVLLVRGRPSFDPAAYVRLLSAACQNPRGAVMCGDAALVASGSSNEAANFTNWALVVEPGKRGCSLGDVKACYAMSQLYTNKSSPYRNLTNAIPYSRRACAADIIFGCYQLMTAVQELPDPALGQYADDYLLSFEKACQLGKREACSEVPRARKMKARAAQYGAANAVHMLYVDNGIDAGNWGGSVIHAIEVSRAPAVVEYAVGRVASAGKMSYVRQQDLPVIVRMLGNTNGARAARSEMNRRGGGSTRAQDDSWRYQDSSGRRSNARDNSRSGYESCTKSNGASGQRYWYYGFDNQRKYGPCL